MLRLLLAACLIACAAKPEPEQPAAPPDPAMARPQTPPAAPDYPTEDMAVSAADGISLAGTLSLPGTAGPYPAVLLLTDSGPHDRNGAIAAHRPQAVWADHFARNGIATLRLDDRGVGQSAGSLAQADLNLLVADALAATTVLATHAAIDGKRVFLLGHGEGGVVATHAAQGRDDLAGLVLLNTPGTTGRRVLLDQAEALLIASGAPADRAFTHRSAH